MKLTTWMPKYLSFEPWKVHWNKLSIGWVTTNGSQKTGAACLFEQVHIFSNIWHIIAHVFTNAGEHIHSEIWPGFGRILRQGKGGGDINLGMCVRPALYGIPQHYVLSHYTPHIIFLKSSSWNIWKVCSLLFNKTSFSIDSQRSATFTESEHTIVQELKPDDLSEKQKLLIVLQLRRRKQEMMCSDI